MSKPRVIDEFSDFGRRIDGAVKFTYEGKKTKTENFPSSEETESENFSKIENSEIENFSKSKPEKSKGENFSKTKIENFSDFDQLEKVVKKNIWPKPKLGEKDKFLEYCIYQVWKAVRAKPIGHSAEEIREYFDELVELRDTVESFQSPDDLDELMELIVNANKGAYPLTIYRNINTDNLTREHMEETRFGFTKHQIRPRKPYERKIRLGYLESGERVGIDIPEESVIDSQKIQDKFGFFAGQFGSGTKLKSRKAFLKQCYEALMDLAYILDINPLDISHRGFLAIAFGSRGIGKRAYSHYEIGTKVIHFTRDFGSGLFAQEWFNSLNHYLSTIHNLHGMYYTEIEGEYKSLNKIVEFVKNEGTEYFNTNKRLDEIEEREKPFWTVPESMISRAFTTYIIDKLAEKGYKNEYLAYEYPGIKEENEKEVPLFPVGKDREVLNKLFDELIKELKDESILGSFSI